MVFARKLLLMVIALAFAFFISSCNDQKKKRPCSLEQTCKEKPERHHSKW